MSEWPESLAGKVLAGVGGKWREVPIDTAADEDHVLIVSTGRLSVADLEQGIGTPWYDNPSKEN